MIAMILFGLVGPGCGSLVATTDIKQSRMRLNEAIRQTTEEQILNAIVETRFGHGPTYLNIAAINAQLAWSAQAGGTWSPDGPSSLVPEISYQEQPTITYSPLTGEEYVRQIMAPVTLDTLLLFLSAGWSIGDVFNIVVQRMGPESNGSFTSPRSTHDVPPSVRGFRRAMEIMSDLQIRGELALSILGDHHYPTVGWGLSNNLITKYQYDSAQSPLTLNFHRDLMDPNHPEHEEFLELLDLLDVMPESLTQSNRLYPESLTLVLQSSTYPGASGMKIKTRSFHQMVWYLSFAVEVPEEAIANEEIWLVRNEDGSPFDFTRTYEGILRVRCSDTRPSDAAILTRYQGHWYSIARNDLPSKQTFVLLGQMVQMQSSASSSVPALTIGSN